MLLLLDEGWVPRLPEDIEENMMFLRDNLRHEHVDEFVLRVDLIGSVAEHLAKLAGGGENAAEVCVGPADDQESRLVHVHIQLILVEILLKGLVHTLYLLHLLNIVSMHIVAVQYVEVEVCLHEVEVAVSLVNAKVDQESELVLRFLDQLRCSYATLK